MNDFHSEEEAINKGNKPKTDKNEFSLKEKIASLPTKPGIYKYSDSAGTIIYVGKAINLRNRVKSYFQSGRPVDAKTKVLIQKIVDVEIIVTDSEAEALILENTLIKKYKPRYNIMLKDDKTYPYVRVTNEDYPRMFVTRRVIRDGSKYYGPFTEAGQLKALMKTIRSLFMLRSCDYKINAESIATNKYKLCLDYHIKKCDGPCEGLISKELYNQNVKHAVRALNGKTEDIRKHLKTEMERLSEEMLFEEAAVVRNKYLQLNEYLSKQKIVTTELIDRDIFGFARVDSDACVLVFKVRDGKLLGKRHFIITKVLDQPDERILQKAAEKWYFETGFVPKDVMMPFLPEDSGILTKWMKSIRKKNVELFVPQLGDKKKFVNMASINAEFQLKEYHLAISKREQTVPHVLKSIQRDLRMKNPPIRIECFDNSHIQGTELVSSCVVFENGRPKKSDYRKFIIRTVEGNDDFAAMKEVVSRRYTRLIKEKAQLPDLIIIDGGKGQLSQAVDILNELGISDKILVVGLAKRLDEIFFPGESESLVLPRASSSLMLIQHLRDEAHRFAISFHRQLRDKRTLQTELTEIPGVGEKTAQKLLVEFGSVENVKKTSFEELSKIVNARISKAVIEFYESGKD